MAVEEEDRRQRLALGGDGDSPHLRQIGQKSVEVVTIEVSRVAAVELDVASDPGGVCLFGADRVVADAELGSDPVHQAPGAPGGRCGEGFDLSHDGVNEA